MLLTIDLFIHRTGREFLLDRWNGSQLMDNAYKRVIKMSGYQWGSKGARIPGVSNAFGVPGVLDLPMISQGSHGCPKPGYDFGDLKPP